MWYLEMGIKTNQDFMNIFHMFSLIDVRSAGGKAEGCGRKMEEEMDNTSRFHRQGFWIPCHVLCTTQSVCAGLASLAALIASLPLYCLFNYFSKWKEWENRKE